MPVQQIQFLGLEMKLFLLQRKVEEIVQISQNAFDKVTREIDFHNSRNFTSEMSDSFPATDTNTCP